MIIETSDSLQGRQQQANQLLDRFAAYTPYRHGSSNRYLKWLGSKALTLDQVTTFLMFWYPVSRHQPQILLQCMVNSSRRNDRLSVLPNWFEEDGMGPWAGPALLSASGVDKKLDPSFELDKKIVRDNGSVSLDDQYEGDPESKAKVSAFHDKLYRKLSAAEVSGLIAAIEHPALDISAYFNQIVALFGRHDLLETDTYLLIHIDVEPSYYCVAF